MTLGEELRAARLRKGWSMGDVSRNSDGRLGTGYVSLLENNDRQMVHPNTLRAIADGYEVSYEQLLVWAGYLDEPRDELHRHRPILRSLGPNPSDEELEACRQALRLVRGTGGRRFFERFLAE